MEKCKNFLHQLFRQVCLLLRSAVQRCLITLFLHSPARAVPFPLLTVYNRTGWQKNVAQNSRTLQHHQHPHSSTPNCWHYVTSASWQSLLSHAGADEEEENAIRANRPRPTRLEKQPPPPCLSQLFSFFAIN